MQLPDLVTADLEPKEGLNDYEDLAKFNKKMAGSSRKLTHNWEAVQTLYDLKKKAIDKNIQGL